MDANAYKLLYRYETILWLILIMNILKIQFLQIQNFNQIFLLASFLNHIL